MATSVAPAPTPATTTATTTTITASPATSGNEIPPAGAAEEPSAGHEIQSDQMDAALAVALVYDFFLSHYQATGGDQVMTLELRLSNMGYECWLDQKADSITKESMRAGVADSRVFLLFLSQGVLERPFCLFEIATAMEMSKNIMLMHETDFVS